VIVCISLNPTNVCLLFHIISYFGAKIGNISETCKDFEENAIVLARDCENYGTQAYGIRK
jgi:hypothetical protein